MSKTTNHLTKYIVLWSPPRCVSTAFEKTFSQRPDTEIVHEPFTGCYYHSRWRKTDRYDDCEAMLDYDGEKAIATIKSKSGPLVFCKAITYQAVPYLKTEFLTTVTNTFLVRDPKAALASNKKLEPVFPLEEFGFDQLDQMWTIVTEELGQEPIVVESDRFRRDPETILRRYCEKIGVEFMPQMLRWEDGRIKTWDSHESLSQAQWHQTLESSKTILPPPEEEVEVEIRPEEVAMMERATKIYEKLSALAL